MMRKQIIINNPTGLHARPAAIFVENANKFISSITVKKDDQAVDGKSILSLLTLGVEKGDKIEIEIEGSDEKEAFDFILELLEEGLGE